MEKLRNIEKIVLEILQTYSTARGDDYLLYCLVVAEYFERNPHLGDLSRLSFVEVMCRHYILGIPSYETVTRARRKIQAAHPELKVEAAERRRKKEEQRFREYARSVSL